MDYATEICSLNPPVFSESIGEARRALNHCFNNRFDEAQHIIDTFPSQTSLYHSITESHFACLQALFTFEPHLIDIAHAKVRRAAEVCSTLRRKQSLSQTVSSWWVGDTSFQHFTELELHAELCHAECLLAAALLTFIQDEQLHRFIEGALKIRSSYSTYKYCMQAMLNKKSSSASNHKDFESGVYMGMGTFNVLLSLLPPRILKLLEWVGFQGDRKEGLEWLDTGLRLGGLRSPVCAMALLTYHLIAIPSIGVPSSNDQSNYIKVIAEQSLQEFPDGSVFLYYSARLKLSQGLVEEAMSTYDRAVNLHTEWQQVRHLSYWGQMWGYSYQGKWTMAAQCAELLAEESRWSKCIYSYLHAAFLLMQRYDTRTAGEDFVARDEMDQRIDLLMESAKKYKKRIAGKSLQMEKLAVSRADRYQRTGKLILPALEMIYLWNGFGYMSKRGEMLEHILSMISAVLDEEPEGGGEAMSTTEQHNKTSLCFLLKGACLRHLKRTKEAENYLMFVANSVFVPETCEYDSYVAPYASAEMGAVYADQGDFGKAIAQYEKTLTSYSKYGLESRLHFRLHNRIDFLKEMQSNGVTTTSMQSSGEENSGHSDEEFFDAED